MVDVLTRLFWNIPLLWIRGGKGPSGLIPGGEFDVDSDPPGLVLMSDDNLEQNVFKLKRS